MMHCFTSIINNYIPKARILAKSLKQYNPGWKLHVIISEPLDPSVQPESEPFDSIIALDQLEIENLESWIFKHKVTEICTAVKGQATLYLLDLIGADRIIYFDPDIVVFNSLKPLEDLLDKHPIILTPHQNKPDRDYQTIIDNEIGSLRWGVFNLGFFALRNDGQGREFAEWWRDRLMEFCYDDIPFGLFTDQRWCDLAPVFFDKLYILRDPEYNVATWNLSQRNIRMASDGTILADGAPLRFYHFSGYDSGAGSTMVKRFIPDEKHLIYEIWSWYEQQLVENGQEILGNRPWHYSKFDNGELILDEMRLLYRNRRDLQTRFPNPFTTKHKDGGYLAWWKAHTRESVSK